MHFFLNYRYDIVLCHSKFLCMLHLMACYIYVYICFSFHDFFSFITMAIPLAVLLDFSLTVKAETLIFISGCGSAISSAKEGKSGFIYNFVKS